LCYLGQSTFNAEPQNAQRAKRTEFQHIDQTGGNVRANKLGTAHHCRIRKRQDWGPHVMSEDRGNAFPSTENRPRPRSQHNKRGRDASQRPAVKRKRRVARDLTYDECDANETPQCADNWSIKNDSPWVLLIRGLWLISGLSTAAPARRPRTLRSAPCRGGCWCSCPGDTHTALLSGCQSGRQRRHRTAHHS
jgi:hypothetical protein